MHFLQLRPLFVFGHRGTQRCVERVPSVCACVLRHAFGRPPAWPPGFWVPPSPTSKCPFSWERGRQTVGGPQGRSHREEAILFLAHALQSRLQGSFLTQVYRNHRGKGRPNGYFGRWMQNRGPSSILQRIFNAFFERNLLGFAIATLKIRGQLDDDTSYGETTRF